MNELISIILGVVIPAAISVFTLYQSKKNRQAEAKKTNAEAEGLEHTITERVLKLADSKLIEYENKLKEYEQDITILRGQVKTHQEEIEKLYRDIGIYKRNQTRLIKTIKALLDQMKEEGITPVVAFDLTELEEAD
jgi:chromosome segregation ATPase